MKLLVQFFTFLSVIVVLAFVVYAEAVPSDGKLMAHASNHRGWEMEDAGLLRERRSASPQGDEPPHSQQGPPPKRFESESDSRVRRQAPDGMPNPQDAMQKVPMPPGGK